MTKKTSPKSSKNPPKSSSQEKQILELEKKLTTTEDQLNRTLADLENFRKRTLAEREKTVQQANRSLLLSLLPTLDNFERAFATLPPDANPEWLKGFRQIYENLSKNLASVGLKRIPALDQPFDPNLHEAILTAPGPKDIILQELTPGYTLNNEIIRHTQVQIGDGSSKK